MTEEEKKTITREKHLGRVTQGHKLASLMKKRKEEILRNKEKFTEQSTVQSTVQSNGAYIYSVGTHAVLAIGVCVFFAYKSSWVVNKKQEEKQDQPPKRRNML